MLLVKRADKINETRTGGIDHTATAVAVTKGKPERRDSENWRIEKIVQLCMKNDRKCDRANSNRTEQRDK